MPQLSAEKPLSTKLRLMLFGPPKTFKTGFVGMAAKTNANVYFFMGESNESILNQVPDEFKHRVRIVKAIDNPRNKKGWFYHMLFNTFVESGKSVYKINEDSSREFSEADRKHPEGVNIAEIRQANLGPDDIVVIDSATALVQSVTTKHLGDQGVSTMNELKDKRAYYGVAANMFNAVMKSLMALPCHVVVIGHNQVREIKDKDDNSKTVAEYTQVLTTSATQGVQTASMFNQVVYTGFNNLGKLKYSTVPNHDIVTGGTILPPKTWTADELSMAEIMSAVGVSLDKDNPMTDVITYTKTEPFKG